MSDTDIGRLEIALRHAALLSEADDLTRMVRNRAEKAASQAELQARQLRARLGEDT